MKTKIAVLLFICITLSLLTACAPGTPSEVAEKYLSALKNGSVHTMADCLAPEAAQQLRELSRLLSRAPNGPHLFAIAPGIGSPPTGDSEVYHVNFEVTGEGIEEDTAWVEVEVAYTTDEKVYTQELLLMLQHTDGRWVIAEG